MTMLFDLSELARSLFSLWALLLCLGGVSGMILAVSRKRFRFAVGSLFPFLCAYFLWQMLFDLHLSGSDALPVSRFAGSQPWLYWLAVLLVLTLAEAALLTLLVRYGRNSVTPEAVKLCLDRMPCGVCCWRDNGRVLFSNICMNRLCLEATGSPLLNGNQFFAAVSDGILALGTRVWRFTSREIPFDGENLHEMIASDVTDTYARTQALEKDKAALSRLNRELQEYNLSMDETVRRQEILQAKVNIHDEMNRLMLSTMAAESGDASTMDRILALWEQNALLLCMEADETNDSKAEGRIEKLAEVLKIRLIRQGAMPAVLSEAQRALFFSAAQEAIANAAKHAQAETMTVSFSETETSVTCAFASDGKMPTGQVRFAGGLANLSRLAEKQGASVSATADIVFTLCLTFPKNANQPNG